MQKGIYDMIYDVARVKKQLTMIWHTMMDQARTYMDMNFEFAYWFNEFITRYFKVLGQAWLS